MEALFRTLRRAHIRRGSLYLAWDFTVSSRRSLSERLLTIRNQAFAELGDRNLKDLRVAGAAPHYAIDSVRNFSSGPVLREVHGRVTVPCFLNRPGCPAGSRFRLDRRGLPVRIAGNTTQARFICVVPRSASAAHPALPVLFGHGLFQDASAVLGGTGTAFAALGGLPCATDWTGLSTADVGAVADVAQELSRFPTVPDRLQQALVNFMYLGRLMIHPQGLGANPLFRSGGGPAIDAGALSYLGGSLGGIEGGALSAVAPDFTHAALAVPAMNFSLLLPRSTDAAPLLRGRQPLLPDPLTSPLILSMTELLWERGEANAYAWHLTRSPYPNTPRHRVLLHEAFGDHRVANVATEVEVRTIGARLRTPSLDPGRSRDRRPFYRIERIPGIPYRGNALVVWDIGPLRAGGTLGTPPPPTTNTPNRAGVDPHSITAFEPTAGLQFLDFLRPGGAFVDTWGLSLLRGGLDRSLARRPRAAARPPSRPAEGQPGSSASRRSRKRRSASELTSSSARR
jgi:hypothetical protein